MCCGVGPDLGATRTKDGNSLASHRGKTLDTAGAVTRSRPCCFSLTRAPDRRARSGATSGEAISRGSLGSRQGTGARIGVMCGDAGQASVRVLVGNDATNRQVRPGARCPVGAAIIAAVAATCRSPRRSRIPSGWQGRLGWLAHRSWFRTLGASKARVGPSVRLGATVSSVSPPASEGRECRRDRQLRLVVEGGIRKRSGPSDAREVVGIDGPESLVGTYPWNRVLGCVWLWE